MGNNNKQSIEDRIEQLSSKVGKIESQVSRIDKSKDFDYQKVLSAMKYLYKYYDDMTKDRGDITSM